MTAQKRNKMLKNRLCFLSTHIKDACSFVIFVKANVINGGVCFWALV